MQELILEVDNKDIVIMSNDKGELNFKSPYVKEEDGQVTYLIPEIIFNRIFYTFLFDKIKDIFHNMILARGNEREIQIDLAEIGDLLEDTCGNIHKVLKELKPDNAISGTFAGRNAFLNYKDDKVYVQGPEITAYILNYKVS